MKELAAHFRMSKTRIHYFLGLLGVQTRPRADALSSHQDQTRGQFAPPRENTVKNAVIILRKYFTAREFDSSFERSSRGYVNITFHGEQSLFAFVDWISTAPYDEDAYSLCQRIKTWPITGSLMPIYWHDDTPRQAKHEVWFVVRVENEDVVKLGNLVTSGKV